ncbi:MAG: hypothetical protein ABIJ34_06340 [archaeon]
MALTDEILGSPRMFGIETEFFLIDNEGKIVSKADEILGLLKKKMRKSSLTKEVGNAMFEHITFPHTSAKASFSNLFNDYESILYELESKEIGIFNFGTYPGKNTGTARQDKRYQAKANILGKRQFEAATKCIGFHFHASLPRKSFNNQIKFFFIDIQHDTQQKVLDLFNFDIAADPAITTLMQSSPYYESKLLGKDARLMVYRGDTHYGVTSLYENHPQFGTLNEYAHSFDEMVGRIKKRTHAWKELLAKEDATLEEFAKKDSFPSVLDSSWKPVKISPHGTIESRGCDMNSFSRILGLSSALKYLSMHIQKSSVAVKQCEEGNNNPFLEEDGELFVPTFDKIKALEKSSAEKGFGDDDVYEYAKSFIKYARSIMPSDERGMLDVFQKSIDERKTMSDEIISYVKKKQGDTSIIDDETSQEFSVRTYERMYKDLLNTKKHCYYPERHILPKVELIWD